MFAFNAHSGIFQVFIPVNLYNNNPKVQFLSILKSILY